MHTHLLLISKKFCAAVIIGTAVFASASAGEALAAEANRTATDTRSAPGTKDVEQINRLNYERTMRERRQHPRPGSNP